MRESGPTNIFPTSTLRLCRCESVCVTVNHDPLFCYVCRRLALAGEPRCARIVLQEREREAVASITDVSSGGQLRPWQKVRNLLEANDIELLPWQEELLMSWWP